MTNVGMPQDSAATFEDYEMDMEKGLGGMETTGTPTTMDEDLPTFRPFDDYTLQEKIRLRTQGSDEPIHVYFAKITYLFSKLRHTLSEREKIEILLNNIRPTYALPLALQKITSIDDLLQKCKKINEAMARSASFIEPPKPIVGYYPELGYQRPSKSQENKEKLCTSTTLQQMQERPSTSTTLRQIQVPLSSSTTRTMLQQFKDQPSTITQYLSRINNICSNCGKQGHTSIFCIANKACSKCGKKGHIAIACMANKTCFSCGKIGHIYTVCSARRRIECFSCGNKGYTTRTCPLCSTNVFNFREK